MPNKKPTKSEKPDGDPVMVRRADAIVSVDQLETTPEVKVKPPAGKPKSKAKASAAKAAKPPATKTAPKLSPKLLEGLETNYEAESPEPETPPEPEAETPEAPEAPDLEPIEDPAADDIDPLEDDDTDQAVDDIVAHEGDTVLAVNDALVAREEGEAEPAGPRVKHMWAWFILFIVLAGSAVDAYIFLSK
jgi:hypothetical protein